jgi:hypothetical protein
MKSIRGIAHRATQLVRLLGWRIQADELRTELTSIQQRTSRFATGLLVHF